MPLKTPRFWYPQPLQDTPMGALLLNPFSYIYSGIQKIHSLTRKPQKVKVPVICVGNAIAGGSGKTPTAIAINTLLNIPDSFFLTRGYGAQDGSCRVMSLYEDLKSTGDEPRILAKHCKTVISTNRYDGAVLAQKSGAKLIIMDDGFQNNSIHKDLSLLVIDGKMGFGNKYTLPAGPLRESISSAFGRADAVILIGEDQHNILPDIPAHLPVFEARIRPTRTLDTRLQYIGFAGLGYPEKFRQTLLHQYIKVIDFIPFADHHPYSDADMIKLTELAHKHKSTLVTTEKDMERIPENYREKIETLPIELSFNDELAVISFLQDKLNSINSG